LKYLKISAKFLKKISSCNIIKVKGGRKKYPVVIQLPITSKCNSHCVMCNIWHMQDQSDMVSVRDFSVFLKDPIFKEVHSVGINGGEPSMVSNLPDYVKEILKLPKLRSLNIITNGFNNGDFLQNVEQIFNLCKKSDIKFHISLSLDGYGEIHNLIRGREDAFEKTIITINKIYSHKEKYCDNVDVGCTVSQQNVNNLIELDTYCKMKKIKIKYRLAIANKRINNASILNNFCVISNPSQQSAKEFFHRMMSKSTNFHDKFKYFALFYWLNNPKKKRLLGCSWKEEGITMDGNGNIFYCAVCSKNIGSLKYEKGETIFFSKQNINYRKEIIRKECNDCIHDYEGMIELKYILIYIKDIFINKYSMKLFYLRCMTGFL